MAGRLRVTANAHVSIEKADGDKYRHTLTFGRMLSVEKIEYSDDPEYFTLFLASGDIIRGVKCKFFEIHDEGGIEITYEDETIDEVILDEEEPPLTEIEDDEKPWEYVSDTPLEDEDWEDEDPDDDED
jgi:hypothetical protein